MCLSFFYMKKLLLILWLVLGFGQVWGQSMSLSRADIKVEGVDCRVKEEKIRPMIAITNPFFYNHQWDAEKKVEMAQLTPERLLFIEQFGCLRHHAQMKLVISKDAAQPNDLYFYAHELFALMDKVHYGDLRYPHYREDLEAALVKNIERKGLKTKIAFPLLENTYFLYLEPDAEGGATIVIEIVKYVHEENILMPGIKEHLDDGYFKPSPPPPKPVGN